MISYVLPAAVLAATFAIPTVVHLRFRHLPRCPDCRYRHDPRPCATDGASCDCCSAIFKTQDERNSWLTA